MKILRFVSVVVLWIFFICGASLAVERYVALNGTNDGAGGYITWSGASTNIQDAVNKCSDNDVVWVTNGTYYCWSNSAYAGYTSMVTVVRASNITIQSMNGPAFTIVDANYPKFTNRCFYITSNTVVSGFTITNGHAGDVANGGGVYIKTSGRVTNCWITGNSTTNGPAGGYPGGGGVYCAKGGEVLNCAIYANTITNGYGTGMLGYDAGSYIVRDSVISNNYSLLYNGYAMMINVFSSAFVTNCTIINNQGGGMYIANGTAGATVDTCRLVGNSTLSSSDGCGLVLACGIARNCQIYNNAAGNRGGGGSISGEGKLFNSVISSNCSGSSGAGLRISGNSTLVENCTIVSNYHGGSGGGGGALMYSGTMRNCLIANNYGTYGGGLSISASAGGTGRVENCTIVSNRGGAYGGIYSDSSAGTGMLFNTICYSNFVGTTHNNWKDVNAGKLAAYNSCTTPTNDLPGSNNTTNPPALVNIATRNYRLLKSSPCVNTGTNQDWWMTGALDLDGRMRIRYGTVDMGAYETIFGGTYYKFH